MIRVSVAVLIVVGALAFGGCAQKQEDQKTAEGKAPSAEQPVAQKPAAEHPVAEKPAGEQPVAEQPEVEKPAGEQPAEQPAAGGEVPSVPNLKVATYDVPNLTMDLARQLTMALAANGGVVSAKADETAGLFMVTYSAGCPYGILSALQGVVPDAKLKGVAAREGGAPEQGGCGGCPKKSTCDGSH